MLPVGGVDLRIVAPDGTSGHTRRFYPGSVYVETLSAQVLRKADGTGFFIPLVQSNLPGAEYRMDITYRRDNRHIDPESQVLSEAGDTSAERVILDIPWE